MTCKQCGGATRREGDTFCTECWANGVGEAFVLSIWPGERRLTVYDVTYWRDLGYSYRDRIFTDAVMAARS